MDLLQRFLNFLLYVFCQIYISTLFLIWNLKFEIWNTLENLKNRLLILLCQINFENWN